MNRAIRTFQPSSGWITTGLLTVFVIAFGLFAGAHAPSETQDLASPNGLMVEICQTRQAGSSRGMFRYL